MFAACDQGFVSGCLLVFLSFFSFFFLFLVLFCFFFFFKCPTRVLLVPISDIFSFMLADDEQSAKIKSHTATLGEDVVCPRCLYFFFDFELFFGKLFPIVACVQLYFYFHSRSLCLIFECFFCFYCMGGWGGRVLVSHWSAMVDASTVVAELVDASTY